MAINNNVLNSLVNNVGFGTATTNKVYSNDVLSINANLVEMNNNITGEPTRILRIKYNEIIVANGKFDHGSMIMAQDSLAESRVKEVIKKYEGDYKEITGDKVYFNFLHANNIIEPLNRREGDRIYYHYRRVLDFEISDKKKSSRSR